VKNGVDEFRDYLKRRGESAQTQPSASGGEPVDQSAPPEE
jgi:hypothetical protein